MTQSTYLKTPRSAGPELKLGWLKAVCSELREIDGATRPNPAFDAGIRARLRRGLDRPTAAHADARLIGFLRDAGLDPEKQEHVLPFQLVCAVYAWHPHPRAKEIDAEGPWARRGSFGQVCRAIAIEKESKSNTEGKRARSVDTQNNTFTPRFERLVHCRTLEKMFVPIRSIIKMLVSSGSESPIDFDILLDDLCAWESDWARDHGPRMRWMLDYWREDSAPKENPEATPT
jgi:CRISPR type I-E-associated protein CasB/Cse2